MFREIHSPIDSGWRPSDADSYLMSKFPQCPLIMASLRNATTGTTINPYKMFVVGMITSHWYSDLKVDFFSCGISGSLDDQIINAAIEWQKYSTVDELRLTEPQIKAFDNLWKTFSLVMEAFSEREPRTIPVIIGRLRSEVDHTPKPVKKNWLPRANKLWLVGATILLGAAKVLILPLLPSSIALKIESVISFIQRFLNQNPF